MYVYYIAIVLQEILYEINKYYPPAGVIAGFN